MFDENLNIAHIDSSSHIYGPGERYVIWVQGCTLACPGCWNVDMWPHKENKLIHREQVLQDILNTPDISGVTFLGGEPLQQVENVLWILKNIRQAKLSTMLFSGYERSEIDSHKDYAEVLKFLDILVSGRYVSDKRDTGLLWRGSSNQEIVLVSDRHKDFDLAERNQVEIEIGESGQETILGFPDRELVLSIVNP